MSSQTGFIVGGRGEHGRHTHAWAHKQTQTQHAHVREPMMRCTEFSMRSRSFHDNHCSDHWGPSKALGG